jgi:menaquinone-specific isochorismate synthase
MTLSEMHHLYSRIEVSCKDRPTLDAIISALHPTASVCGSPYQEAFNLIASLEGFSRGLYSGPLGIATHDQIECLVSLRSCLLQKNILTVFAGAGIVEGSNHKEEWQELEAKIATILKLF